MIKYQQQLLEKFLNKFFDNKEKFLQDLAITINIAENSEYTQNNEYVQNSLNIKETSLLFEFAIHENRPEYLNVFCRIFDDDGIDTKYDLIEDNINDEISVGYKLGGIINNNELYYKNAPYGFDTYERQNIKQSVWWILGNEIRYL